MTLVCFLAKTFHTSYRYKDSQIDRTVLADLHYSVRFVVGNAINPMKCIIETWELMQDVTINWNSIRPVFFISGVMLLSSASVDYSHTMILSAETANQGDSMTASCTIKSDSKVSVMVIWQKKTFGEKKLVEIATNIFINNDFKATNRYFGENVDNSTNTTSNVMFSLKITGRYFFLLCHKCYFWLLVFSSFLTV